LGFLKGFVYARETEFKRSLLQIVMEAAEDDELQLLRISEGLVADLQKLLRRVLWKKSQSGQTDELKVHRVVKLRDLDRLIQKV
jgi:hypothetical protein